MAGRRLRSENRNQDAGYLQFWGAIVEVFWPHGMDEHQDVLQLRPSLDKHGPCKFPQSPHGLGIDGHFKQGAKSPLQYQWPRDPEASCSPSVAFLGFFSLPSVCTFAKWPGVNPEGLVLSLTLGTRPVRPVPRSTDPAVSRQDC